MLLARKELINFIDDVDISLENSEEATSGSNDDVEDCVNEPIEIMRNANVDVNNTLNMSLPLVDWNKDISTEDDGADPSLSETLLNVSIESPDKRRNTKSRVMKGMLTLSTISCYSKNYLWFQTIMISAKLSVTVAS